MMTNKPLSVKHQFGTYSRKHLSTPHLVLIPYLLDLVINLLRDFLWKLLRPAGRLCVTRSFIYLLPTISQDGQSLGDSRPLASMMSMSPRAFAHLHPASCLD